MRNIYLITLLFITTVSLSQNWEFKDKRYLTESETFQLNGDYHEGYGEFSSENPKSGDMLLYTTIVNGKKFLAWTMVDNGGNKKDSWSTYVKSWYEVNVYLDGEYSTTHWVLEMYEDNERGIIRVVYDKKVGLVSFMFKNTHKYRILLIN